MIPYENELGLRDYRPRVHDARARAPWALRWLWLVFLAIALGLVLRGLA